jgi:hypothetical protein
MKKGISITVPWMSGNSLAVEELFDFSVMIMFHGVC